MAKKQTASSVVDFLKKKGADSSFGGRKKLFSQLGLNQDMGEFEGTAEQNTELLNRIQADRSITNAKGGRAPATAQSIVNAKGGRSPSTEPSLSASGVLSATGAGSTTTPEPNQETQPQINSAEDFLRSNPATSPFADALTGVRTETQSSTPATAGRATTSLQEALGDAMPNTGAGGRLSGNGEPTERFDQGVIENAATTSAADAIIENSNKDPEVAMEEARNMSPDEKVEMAGTNSAIGGKGQTSPAVNEAAVTDAATKLETGMSASEILGSEASPSEADLINQYLNSTEGKLMMERQELDNMNAEVAQQEAMAELEEKYKDEKESTLNNLAASGLAFSGIRATQIKALADSLASSQLSVDRDFASKLLDADINFRETVIDGVSDLIASARKNDEEAIDQLNKAGFAVVDDMLVPTLAAENANRTEIYRQAQLALSQRRVEISQQAENRQWQKMINGENKPTEKEAMEILQAFITDPEMADVPRDTLIVEGMKNTGLSKSTVETFVNLKAPPQEEIDTGAAYIVAQIFAQEYNPNDKDLGFLKGSIPDEQFAKNVLAKAKEQAPSRVRAVQDQFGTMTQVEAYEKATQLAELDTVMSYLEEQDDGTYALAVE